MTPAAPYTAASWEVADAAAMLRCVAAQGPSAAAALAALACARLALVHVPAGEDSPQRALALAEARVRGHGRHAAVRVAARAALRAAHAFPDHCAEGSACAAAYYAAQSLAGGSRPEQATHAVALAASFAAPWCVRRSPAIRAVLLEAQRRMGTIVRGHVPWSLVAHGARP